MSTLLAPLLDAPPLVREGLPTYERPNSPAAGAHFTQAIGGDFFVRLVTVFCRLVTDGTAASRTVLVEYRDAAGNRFAIDGAPVTQSASSTNDWAFSWQRGQPDWEVDGTIMVGLSPLLLLPTMDFRVFVDNIQVTDQLSRIAFVWERFYTTGQPRVSAPHQGL